MPTPRRKSTPRPDAAKTPGPSSAKPEINNLETVAHKLKVYSLENLLKAKRAFKTAPPAKLAEVLQPWYEKEIQKPGQKLQAITDLWLELVPAALQPHTRLAGLQRGTLTVSLDSAPVRAQLDMLLRQGLLQKLQGLSKGAVFRVKTVVRSPIMEIS